MPTNTAAWLGAKQAKLEVKPAPYTPPSDDEIVVENRAVAINPVDWNKQVMGDLMFSWIEYPFVLGENLAGEVVEVGKNVTRFEAGDRVLGHAVGTDKSRNNPAEGAFQAYAVVLARMAAPVPGTMSFENAAVLRDRGQGIALAPEDRRGHSEARAGTGASGGSAGAPETEAIRRTARRPAESGRLDEDGGQGHGERRDGWRRRDATGACAS